MDACTTPWTWGLRRPVIVLPQGSSTATFSFGWYQFFGMSLEIVAGDLRIPVAYNARMGVPGWNDIGTFELPTGPVSVTVSDATDGQVVVADAVRWQIVDAPAR